MNTGPVNEAVPTRSEQYDLNQREIEVKIPALLFCATIATQPLLAEESDTVTLTFDWPDQMEGTVSVQYETIKRKGETESTVRLAGSSEIKAFKTDLGYQLESFNHVIDAITDDGNMDDLDKTLMETLGTVSTTAIVSGDGFLQSVTGMESMIEEIKKDIMVIAEDLSDEMQTTMQLMVEDALSDDRLFREAQQNWDSNVGQWIGAELESGFIYEVQYGTPVALLDNQEIPTLGYYEYAGPVKCTEDADTTDCADVRFSSALDEDITSKVLDLIFERWNVERPENIKLAIELEQRLITDPDTLLPYQTSETTRVFNPDPNDGKQAVHIKSKTSQYHYSTLQ